MAKQRLPLEIFPHNSSRHRGMHLAAGWYWWPLDNPDGPAADLPQGPYRSAADAWEAAIQEIGQPAVE